MNSLFQLSDAHFVVGDSPEMKDVYQMIVKASRSDLPVLITGETGVGKEAAARLIHYLSHRKNNYFVKVNCAALSPHLVESEIFGHEKGAFTGAENTRLGRFEIANNGTLLLDEINEMDVYLQAKLLQVVEDKYFERVGSSFPQKVDVRFIATCNQNILNIVKAGKFRADLYYRLNVVSIHIPPLRERKEDILPLVTDFLDGCQSRLNIASKRMHQEAIQILLDYDWPGNIRELFNFLHRITLFVNDDCVMPEQVSELLGKCMVNSQDDVIENKEETLVGLSLSDIEKKTIKSTLFYFGGDVRKTSNVLGITDKTLRNKIKQYSINDGREKGKEYYEQ